jgi:transcriptional regulator with XRE-family HTH domain
MTNLESIRRNRGLQQQELADAAGVPQATVSRAENGKGVTFKSAMRIVRALGLTVEEVFGDVVIDDQPESDASPVVRDTLVDASSEIAALASLAAVG